ncbi:antibiotic biosynthesis monooxygenase [Actinoplanes sp. SE50]|uniref:globin domain-containing protein n=1 Tax=unclassified Actinoplanes TaxID=2626549 RepID=UPI00023EC7F7|nr:MULTISPECIES: antibiotic biosynthesis monooxygenase [unclassified Actinoplanes]AEV85339.1 hemoglobin [Actinoplanes sp. SE50/110]ATO83734.1 antibiotic biosynthesis monooxygenase [Actinoplanes sp. SE50]SLM01142.1 antibiotic biosynthesis monooxygenase [Actinoplanes sp. SE50/110]
MIVEYLRYRVDADRAAGFEQAYQRAAVQLAAAPQCVDYELSRCVDEPAAYLLRITWTSAEDHLKGFRGGELFPGFLAEIRPYVDDIEEMRHYEVTGVHGTGGSVPTMYEWAGGAAAFERLTAAFYTRVLADDTIGPLFAHMDPSHPRYVAMWLSEVFGGPSAYTDSRGGYAHMLGKHLGRAITEQQRRRWVALLVDAADEVGLPDDPEFRAAFMGYIEWGTRLALANSQPGAAPPRQAPVPHWGWGVAPPYRVP